MNTPETERGSFTRLQWVALLALSAIQFVNILDFILVMPLGPHFLDVLSLSTDAFGYMVGSYGYASFFGGVFGAGLINRFERKRTMLALVIGFSFSTLLCYLSSNYYLLVLARCCTGAFGGLVGAMVMTIISDLFPESKRGFAIGIVTTSFSMASVVGVPLGLWLASYFGSPLTPFLCLSLICLPIFFLLLFSLPTIPAPNSSAGGGYQLIVQALEKPRHWLALGFTCVLVFQTFLVVPYLATYCIKNVGLGEDLLQLVYIIGGGCTFISMPLVGKLTDRFGKQVMYRIVVLVAVLPLLLMTHLPPVSSVVCLFVTTLFMVCTSARMVPAQAIITSAASPAFRAGFLSLSGAVQALSTGVAASASALIVGEDSDKKLTNFWFVGILGAGFMLASLVLAKQLDNDQSS